MPLSLYSRGALMLPVILSLLCMALQHIALWAALGYRQKNTVGREARSRTSVSAPVYAMGNGRCTAAGYIHPGLPRQAVSAASEGTTAAFIGTVYHQSDTSYDNGACTWC